MKKFILLLTLFGAFISAQTSSAQMRCDTRITFKDNAGKNFYPIPLVVITHTDSATHSSSPILNFMGVKQWTFNYLDSFTLDTSLQDTAFTVNYFVCGQWYKIDTSYTKEYPNSRERELNMTINVPCERPCDAGFYISDYRAQYWDEYNFYAGQTGSEIYHEWHLGNGVVSYSENPIATYDTVGTVYIKHIMRDTSRSCVDSSIQSIIFAPACNANFYYQDKGSNTYELTAIDNGSSYSHEWIIDNVSVGNGERYSHIFTTPGYHTIQHISSYGSQCSETETKTIYVSAGSCYIKLNTTKSYRQVTFMPELLNIPYHYDFGDGDTGTYTGVFTHLYPMQNANYRVRINDAYRLCNENTFFINIVLNCNARFSVSNPSSFTMHVSRSYNSPLSSRFRLSTGDTISGNSGNFTITTPGRYFVDHDMFDGQGIVQCHEVKEIWVNSCGVISISPFPFRLFGAVSFNGQYLNNYDSIRIYLIKQDPTAGTLTAIDSLTAYSSEDDTAYVDFTLPCDSMSNYFVKAALLPGSGLYSNYIPTYSYNSTRWSGANQVFPSGFVSVRMVAGTNPGGPGFIGGLISQGANKKFKPLSGVQVNLFTQSGDAVTYTFSDAMGAYSFDNIAYGKYEVTVEELGKTSASYWVTLDANNPKVEERNFEVNSNYVSILSTGMKEELSLLQNVYPNPAHDKLTIEWSDSYAAGYQVSFYALDGRLLKSEFVQPGASSQSELDISPLPRGLVMMLIQDGNITQLIKVQIQ